MTHEVAGDPCTGLKWTRRTTQKIARELRAVGIEVSARTVARLLKKLRFSPSVDTSKPAIRGQVKTGHRAGAQGERVIAYSQWPRKTVPRSGGPWGGAGGAEHPGW